MPSKGSQRQGRPPLLRGRETNNVLSTPICLISRAPSKGSQESQRPGRPLTAPARAPRLVSGHRQEPHEAVQAPAPAPAKPAGRRRSAGGLLVKAGTLVSGPVTGTTPCSVQAMAPGAVDGQRRGCKRPGRPLTAPAPAKTPDRRRQPLLPARRCRRRAAFIPGCGRDAGGWRGRRAERGGGGGG